MHEMPLFETLADREPQTSSRGVIIPPPQRYDAPEDITSRKHGGNPESEAAHEAAKPGKAKLWWLILNFVKVNGPSTCSEISAGTSIPYQTASARVSELRKRGLLYPTGRKRRTDTGCFASVLASPRS